MARTIGLGDIAIIFRPLIDILDHQADRRACRPPFEHARKDADGIRLLPLGRKARASRPTLVEKGLNVLFRKREPRRAAIHDRAQSGPMAFAPGGKAEHAAKTVKAHGRAMPRFARDCKARLSSARYPARLRPSCRRHDSRNRHDASRPSRPPTGPTGSRAPPRRHLRSWCCASAGN